MTEASSPPNQCGHRRATGRAGCVRPSTPWGWPTVFPSGAHRRYCRIQVDSALAGRIVDCTVSRAATGILPVNWRSLCRRDSTALRPEAPMQRSVDSNATGNPRKHPCLEPVRALVDAGKLRSQEPAHPSQNDHRPSPAPETPRCPRASRAGAEGGSSGRWGHGVAASGVICDFLLIRPGRWRRSAFDA